MESNAPHTSLRTLPSTLESGLLFLILQPLVGSQFSGRLLLGFSPGWREGQDLSSGPVAPKPRKAAFHGTGYCKHLAAKTCQDSSRLPGFASLSSEPEDFFLFSNLWMLLEHCFQYFIQYFISLSAGWLTGHLAHPLLETVVRFPFVSKALQCGPSTHCPPTRASPLPSRTCTLLLHKERFFGFFHATVTLHLALPLLTPVFLLVNYYSFLKSQTQLLSLVKASLVLPNLLIQDSPCDVCLSFHPVLECLLENPL